MSQIVRHTPRCSQRRPEVCTRSRRQAGAAVRRSRRESSMSSISGWSAKPPMAWNAARCTKIAWSPVAMPVQRERRFISAATTRSRRGRPSMHTSKRPHSAPPATACCTAAAAPAGRRVSACRNSSTAPRARAAPAFICRARPRGPASTASARPAHSAGVPSLLPPSTTSTSCPATRNGASAASVAAMPAASFNAGTTMLICREGGRGAGGGGGMAEDRGRRRLRAAGGVRSLPQPFAAGARAVTAAPVSR